MNRVLRPSDSATEWCLLQNRFDSYRKYALLIKLAGVVELLRGYTRRALRPTVAFPRVVLTEMVPGLWLTQAAR